MLGILISNVYLRHFKLLISEFDKKNKFVIVSVSFLSLLEQYKYKR